VSGDLRVGNFAILAANQRNMSGAVAINLYWIPSDAAIAKTRLSRSLLKWDGDLGVAQATA